MRASRLREMGSVRLRSRSGKVRMVLRIASRRWRADAVKIAKPPHEYRYEGRSEDCYKAAEDAFVDLWQAMLEAGWQPIEMGAALYELIDDHIDRPAKKAPN